MVWMVIDKEFQQDGEGKLFINRFNNAHILVFESQKVTLNFQVGKTCSFKNFWDDWISDLDSTITSYRRYIVLVLQDDQNWSSFYKPSLELEWRRGRRGFVKECWIGNKILYTIYPLQRSQVSNFLAKYSCGCLIIYGP